MESLHFKSKSRFRKPLLLLETEVDQVDMVSRSNGCEKLVLRKTSLLQVMLDPPVTDFKQKVK